MNRRMKVRIERMRAESEQRYSGGLVRDGKGEGHATPP